MPTGLKSNEKLATFNCPRDRWEQFKQQVGKGNAAKTLNAMISAYLEGAIDVNNWTTTEPINGSEWSRELESQVESKLKTAIADLTAEHNFRLAECERKIDTLLIAVNAIKKDVMPQIVDLEGATKLQSELIKTIQKEIARNKWMIDKYADVLLEIEELQIEVATLQETTKEYMKGF